MFSAQLIHSSFSNEAKIELYVRLLYCSTFNVNSFEMNGTENCIAMNDEKKMNGLVRASNNLRYNYY